MHCANYSTLFLGYGDHALPMLTQVNTVSAMKSEYDSKSLKFQWWKTASFPIYINKVFLVFLYQKVNRIDIICKWHKSYSLLDKRRGNIAPRGSPFQYKDVVLLVQEFPL